MPLKSTNVAILACDLYGNVAPSGQQHDSREEQPWAPKLSPDFVGANASVCVDGADNPVNAEEDGMFRTQMRDTIKVLSHALYT